MKLDNVRSFLRRTPFKPFVVRTAGGESHKVTNPESAACSPQSDAVVLWPAEGGMVLLDAGQITEAAYPPGKPSKGAKRGAD